MSWQTEMTPIVRHLIDDVDSARYVDSRIQDSILISAQLMMTEVEFSTTYTIDIPGSGMSPDPTVTATRDNDYINLTCLKTASIILKGEAKEYGRNAVIIKDASATADFKSAYDAVRKSSEQVCNDYKDYKVQYSLGKAPGTAIMTPTTVNNVYPSTFN
jgi:hypothetical protein